MDPLQELEKKIVDLLDKHGVSTWMFVLDDPDERRDMVRFSGSEFWIYGAAKSIVTRVEEVWRQDELRDGHDYAGDDG